MKAGSLTQQAHRFWAQRNLFFLASLCLLASNLVLSFFVFLKSERVLLVPPEITRPLWAENSRVSREYLEEMALFMAHLVLDNSPDRVDYQRHILMKYVAPASYGTLQSHLLAQATTFKKNAVSTSYHPQEVKVFMKENRVRLKGKLSSYVGQKKVSEQEEIFEICFELQHGRLFITSFTPYGKETSHE